ncbi:Phospholipase D1 [Tulasnella sp. 403]|nr:Phospholipase D1 [Tulasnella sp. 403]
MSTQIPSDHSIDGYSAESHTTVSTGMPNLAQIVENVQTQYQAESNAPRLKIDTKGSLSNLSEQHAAHGPQNGWSRPVPASAPSSPRTRPNNFPRTVSLAGPEKQPEHETSTIDPFSADFVRTDSQFRGPWNYQGRDSDQSKRSSKRRGSWAASVNRSGPTSPSDEGGLWRRWVEIPLGLAPDPNAEQPDAHQDQTDDLGPRTASPEPQDSPEAITGGLPTHDDGPDGATTSHAPSRQASTSAWPLTDPLKLFGLSRARSLPHIGGRRGSKNESHESGEPVRRGTGGDDQPGASQSGQKGWAVLKSRLRASSYVGHSPFSKHEKKHSLVVQPSAAAQVDLSDELIAGPLSVIILRMHFERDENGRRRVPVLLQHLRVRVSDSVHPLHNTHAVFRIECEYAMGAARWVIYRELRDFISLHTHYSLSNAYKYRSDAIVLPEFPKTSIPLFNLLNRERGFEPGRAEFARQQRESLENYLIGLIKSVMLRPEANRLCRFFEISALSVALASRGGIQGTSDDDMPLKRPDVVTIPKAKRVFSGKGPHALNLPSWMRSHTPQWWIVRESYLVAVDDPAELRIHDVFLLDADFSIERPKRVYRQFLHLGTDETDRQALDRDGDGKRRNDWELSDQTTNEKRPQPNDVADDQQTDAGTIVSRSTISKFFSLSRRKRGASPSTTDGGKKDMAHLTVPNQGGRERNMSMSSGVSSPQQRPLGIEGNVSQADLKPTHPRESPSEYHYTANAQGTSVQDVPDPHKHGQRFLRRHTSFSSFNSNDDAQSHGIIDPSIGRDPRGVISPEDKEKDPGDSAARREKKKHSKDVSQHTFYIRNGQRRLKLVAKNERQMLQFIASMERMALRSHWTGANRFGSYSPIRLNVSAQWLVDGRDYFWNLSRAMMLAKERIYIHDWWLSPELYLRRPAKEQFRLDRILKRKAEQGVKIFVILYKEVSNRTTPTDSNYAKRRLMALHPNIMVQRSPSHFSTGTFYWAHHEKMCVIDETIAFMGGLDMCFGRWDTPQHILVDDAEPTGMEGSAQIWPGKDYSNARVMDFHSLNKPDEDMYDRTKVARMPWHDVGIQIVGQPARDLCRHFVQRWNYLLRVKTHSRVMPFLVPAPDFKVTELTDQGLTGTCEVQICRSAGPWSLGTATRVEHSIQNAYLKAIELSEHFVYIENQFFVTSTVVNEVPVENNIGDALVHRIIRAHREKTPWRACIVIPLLPGFTFPIDHNDASSIRLIVELQNRSICRGPHSIFSRLRKEGIDPDDYITFFSLRSWGKLGSATLTTEQVYIHAKTMIVDDRLAIIGSANINERSMRGDRDSELACVVRDTDMIDSRMAGKPYRVGRFAHTLRIRLMREHLGVDVDALYEEDLMATQAMNKAEDIKTWDPDHEQVGGKTDGITTVKHHGTMEQYQVAARDTIEQGEYCVGIYGASEALAKMVGKAGKHGQANGDVNGGMNLGPSEKSQAAEKRTYGSDGSEQPGFASSKVPTLEERVVWEHRPREPEEGQDRPLMDAIEENPDSDNVSEAKIQDGTEMFGAPADAALSPATDDRPPNARPGQDEASEAEKAGAEARKQIRKHLSVKTGAKPHTLPTPRPDIDPHGFADPLDPKFVNDVWIATAVHNTEIYRKVFHCTPDDLVTTWKQYKEYLQFQERINKPPKDAPVNAPHVARVPSEGGTAGEEAGGPPNTHPDGEMDPKQSVAADKGVQRSKSSVTDNPSHLSLPSTGGSLRRSADHNGGDKDGRQRRPTNSNEPLEQWERDEFEALLEEVRGHLVIFPTRFLEGEDTANNFLFNSDRLLPMPIFN